MEGFVKRCIWTWRSTIQVISTAFTLTTGRWTALQRRLGLKACIHDYHYLVGIVYLSHLSDLPTTTGHGHRKPRTQYDLDRPCRTQRFTRCGNFQHLICANFYDYFTLPLDNNLNYLKATLGHAYGIALLRSLESQSANEYEQTEMVGSSGAECVRFSVRYAKLQM